MPTRLIPNFVSRELRAQVDLPAVITPRSGGEVAARLRNVSSSGFFAECSARLEIGSTITVFSPELGRVTAQVRWALGYRFGAVFHAGLGREARAMIARLEAGGEAPGDAASLAASPLR